LAPLKKPKSFTEIQPQMEHFTLL